MRNMLLCAILIGAANLAATGCIIVDGGDDNDATGDITVGWNLTPGCPAGADTAELVAEPTDGSQRFTNLFDCVAGSGVIDDVPPNTYDVFVNITDRTGNTLFAQSFLEEDVLVRAREVVDVADFDIFTEDAFFEFSWQITEGGALAPDCQVAHPNYPDPDCLAAGALPCPPSSACASDGACRVDDAGVGFVATFVADTEIIPEAEFVCSPEGTGRTGAQPLGAYSDVIISIVNGDGEAYYDSNAIPSATLDVGNEVEDLGAVVFPL